MTPYPEESSIVVTSQETETADINPRFRFLVTSRRFWIWRLLGCYCFCPGIASKRSTNCSGRVTGSKAIESGRVLGQKILTRFHLCFKASLHSVSGSKKRLRDYNVDGFYLNFKKIHASYVFLSVGKSKARFRQDEAMKEMKVMHKSVSLLTLLQAARCYINLGNFTDSGLWNGSVRQLLTKNKFV